MCNDVTLDHLSPSCTQTFITLLNIQWARPVMCTLVVKQIIDNPITVGHYWRAHLSLTVDGPSLWLRGCWCILETLESHTLSQTRFVLLYIGRWTDSVIMLILVHFENPTISYLVPCMLLYNGCNWHWSSPIQGECSQIQIVYTLVKNTAKQWEWIKSLWDCIWPKKSYKTDIVDMRNTIYFQNRGSGM